MIYLIANYLHATNNYNRNGDGGAGGLTVRLTGKQEDNWRPEADSGEFEGERPLNEYVLHNK